MFKIFSTREIALGIYVALIVLWVFSSKKIRSSAIRVIKTACTRQILVPFFLMLIYATMIVYLLSPLDFWKRAYLKDIIIWVIFAGVPSCFNAVEETIEDHYFCHILTSNFKLTVFAEFFLGIFTFSLPVELLLQLMLFLLFAMQAIANKNEQYKTTKSLLDLIIALFGTLILYFTVKKAITTYSELGVIDTFVSFSIPILLSALYVPVAYIFAVYARYQILFIRLNSRSSKDKKIRFKHNLQIIRICQLSYKKVCRFEKEYVNRCYTRMSERDFNLLITEFPKKK